MKAGYGQIQWDHATIIGNLSNLTKYFVGWLKRARVLLCLWALHKVNSEIRFLDWTKTLTTECRCSIKYKQISMQGPKNSWSFDEATFEGNKGLCHFDKFAALACDMKSATPSSKLKNGLRYYANDDQWTTRRIITNCSPPSISTSESFNYSAYIIN
jgi:hypothetical protein